MRLYPDTLFGRLMTALLLVFVITGVVIAWLVMREREEVVFWGGESADLVDFLASTTEDIAALPPEKRFARVAELRQTPVTFGQESDRRLKGPPRYDIAAAARSYEKQLQRKLGRDYRVDVRPALQQRNNAIRIGGRRFTVDGQRPGPRRADRLRQLDVTIGLPGGGLVEYRVPAPRLGGPLPRGIFVQLGLLTAVLAIVLFLMARGVTRPLSALAESAEAMSRGENPPPLPESGARELQEATHAFNTLNERLQRYMNSRNSLLAAISHDLRTPLTRLRLRAEKVSDPELRARFQRDVDEMNALLQSALDVFRGMRNDEATTSVDVMAMLGKICVDFAETGKTVTLEGGAAAPIEARPDALQRCVTNLVSNAVKYGDRATIHVHDGPEFEIRVTDDGPGIPDEFLDKVFEPFYRLEDSRNPETGGTGLGLSIARDIAQAHGGSLVLRNRSSRGLEAILTLPRA
jgi:signal transduction histidine kinase